MNTQSAVPEASAICERREVLHLPTVASYSARLAEQAVSERRTHLCYLEALLRADLENLERRMVERRLREADRTCQESRV